MNRAGSVILTVARAIVLLAAALYFGGEVGLGAVAAPEIFRTLRDNHATSADVVYLKDPQQLGGEVFGNVLNRFRPVEVAAVILIATGLAAEWVMLGGHRGGRVWRIVSAALLAAVAVTLVYDVQLTNHVWDTRTTWRAALGTPEADALKAAFDKLHHQSEAVGHLKVYLLAALLVSRAGGMGPRGEVKAKEVAGA